MGVQIFGISIVPVGVTADKWSEFVFNYHQKKKKKRLVVSKPATDFAAQGNKRYLTVEDILSQCYNMLKALLLPNICSL